MDYANMIFTFGIPALMIGSMVWRRVAPRQAPTARTPIAIDPAQATPGAPLTMRQWLDYVNAQPDRVPHLAVIGPSGSGKTTLTTAVLHDRAGRIVVITAKEGDHWGGLPYVGIDDDATYTTALATFAALDREIRQRLIAAKHQRLTADWLTIVVDDFSTLVKECPDAATVVKLVARLGRSLRVRLVMLSDSALVKAIGLEGEGETRSNFAFLRLARGHGGSLAIEDTDIPIDTSMVDRVAKAARLDDRAWQIPRDLESELAALIGVADTSIRAENSASMGGIGYQYHAGIADTAAVSGGITGDTGITPRDRAILAILAVRPDAGKNEIFNAVGGNRNAVHQRIDELRTRMN